MWRFLRRLLHVAPEERFSQADYDRHDAAKQAGLEAVLGPMGDLAGHAIVPFDRGGAVDMYHFPHRPPGVGLATMDLIQPDGRGPRPNALGTYELVAFTRRKYPSFDRDAEGRKAFDAMERRLRGILTAVARYGRDAVLNPGETCETPCPEDGGHRCVVFDAYAPDGAAFRIDGKPHGLLLCVEVHPSELAYAMDHGGAALLEKLKAAGHYPYSDLDREAVV